MKILDRYVIRSFLKNYLISFLVLVGMYVVLDMIFNFDELVEVRDDSGRTGLESLLSFAGYVFDFYFFQVPLVFVHLSGIIPVVAAAFTLMRMVRFNELSALLSAGVPLRRVAMPIIVVAMLLQALLLVDQELIIPAIIPKLVRSHDHGRSAHADTFSIDPLRDDSGALLVAGRYLPNADPPRMEDMSVIRMDELSRPVSHLKARVATWEAANLQWVLTDGQIDRNLSGGGEGDGRAEPASLYRSNITPTEIQLYRSGDYVELLSTNQINEMLQRPLSYGRADLVRVKHTRVSQVVVNIILLLLAIACVLTREPQQLKTAAMRCVICTGACMTVAFLGQQLAGQPPPDLPGAAQWPALMAWLPIFIFGPIAVWLLDRIKT